MKTIVRRLTFLACLWAGMFDINASADSVLYATDASSQQLFTLSTATASRTLVGDFGVSGFMADLTYDGHTDTLFGTTTQTDTLYSINRATGVASSIGPLGISLMHSIAFDNVNGILFGVSVFNSALYRISTSTGQAVMVGPTGISPGSPNTIYGLAFNPADNFLYGCRSGPSDQGGLFRINTTTGQATFLFSSTIFSDLAFHPETGVLYGVDNGLGLRPGALFTIDLANGTTSRIGSTDLGNGLGLEFVPVPEPSALSLLVVGVCMIRLARVKSQQ